MFYHFSPAQVVCIVISVHFCPSLQPTGASRKRERERGGVWGGVGLTLHCTVIFRDEQGDGIKYAQKKPNYNLDIYKYWIACPLVSMTCIKCELFIRQLS